MQEYIQIVCKLMQIYSKYLNFIRRAVSNMQITIMLKQPVVQNSYHILVRNEYVIFRLMVLFSVVIIVIVIVIIIKSNGIVIQ